MRKLTLEKKYYNKFLKIFFITFLIIILLISTYLLIQANKNLISKDTTIIQLKEENGIKNLNSEQIKNMAYLLTNQEKLYSKNPTYQEAINFINNDSTDSNKYNYAFYNCVHFSRDVNNNAEKQGYRCAFIKVNMSGGTKHALIAFNTSDNGLLFIEPQTDQIVILNIGEDYWSKCIQGGESKGLGWIVEDYTIYW